jgi:hypothetical protein
MDFWLIDQSFRESSRVASPIQPHLHPGAGLAFQRHRDLQTGAEARLGLHSQAASYRLHALSRSRQAEVAFAHEIDPAAGHRKSSPVILDMEPGLADAVCNLWEDSWLEK